MQYIPHLRIELKINLKLIFSPHKSYNHDLIKCLDIFLPIP